MLKHDDAHHILNDLLNPGYYIVNMYFKYSIYCPHFAMSNRNVMRSSVSMKTNFLPMDV